MKSINALPLNSNSESTLYAAHKRVELPRWVKPLCVLAAWTVILFGCLFRAPRLGDHEVIVAQTARQMVLSGDWVVPHYLDTPFLLKPPLSYWLVALTSYLFPNGAGGEPPVGEAAARLPSILASLATLWIVWRLGTSMFGPVSGRMAAIAYGAAFGTLLFALNATSEALLTLFCTWVFAETWWATFAPNRRVRVKHLVRLYFAFGLAMFAKGPMPIVVVGIPIAMWLVLEQPLCVAPTCDRRQIRNAISCIPPNVLQSCRLLGISWGWVLPILLALPWVVAVYIRHPYVLELWRYEYIDRLQGKYPGSGKDAPWYYIPILLGMVAPWTLSIPQALASPFRAVHSNIRRPLVFVWCWVVFGLAACSCMSFKKPYYILPIIPGCALLLGPTLDRFFNVTGLFSRKTYERVRDRLPGLALSAVVVLWVIGGSMLPAHLRLLRVPMIVIAAGALFGLSISATWFFGGRRSASFLALAVTSFAMFTGSWLLLGRTLDNCELPQRLATTLDLAGVPRNAKVVWCDGRPDGRLTFYFDRQITQIMDPYRAIVDNQRSGGASNLLSVAAERVFRMLHREPETHFVFSRQTLDLFTASFRPSLQRVAVVPRGPSPDDRMDWVVVKADQEPGQ